MTLFEIVTDRIGESYCRVYCWAESREQARLMFRDKYPAESIRCIETLFSDHYKPFVSKLSDCGFERD